MRLQQITGRQMIEIFTTGGTFDKIYFDALSEFSIGDAQAPNLLNAANIRSGFSVCEVCKKDSLDLTVADRDLLCEKLSATASNQILITHGTDTMVESAKYLAKTITNKTVVFLGAMQPARMAITDAPFNLGFAFAAVQLLPAGIYIAMNGQVFPYNKVAKNRKAGQFEAQD